jgi:hypothetical protein
MSVLVEYLKSNGPQISKDILANWGNSKQTDSAKRKSLERAISSEPTVNKLTGIWSNNASFVYLISQYKKPKFYDNLIEAFEQHSSTCYAIFNALKLHGGRLSKDELAAYCGSPIQPLKGHKYFDDYIKFLSDIMFLFDNDDTYELNPNISPPDPSKGYAVSISKGILMANFNTWASNNNFQAWDSAERFGEFAKFSWGHKSPSYISGIKKNKTIPGFLVADFLIGQTIYDENDIYFFLRKNDIIGSVPGFPKSIPILICDTKFGTNAFSELKKRGIVACTSQSLFGKQYADALKSVYDTILSISNSIGNNPDRIVTLISNIEKLVDGKTNNLRGDIFELAVALYFTQDHRSVMINQFAFFDGKKKEIDVKAESSGDIFFSECKAYKNPIKLDVVKKWVEEKVPVIANWYKHKEDGDAKKMHFEFWSVGGFEPDALAYLHEKKAKLKKYEVDFWGKTEIQQKANSSRFPKLKSIIKEYFDV